MDKKISVTVLCGGVSTEHEVSIQSAMNVIQALNKEKYSVALIYVTHQGEWLHSDDTEKCVTQGVAKMVRDGVMLSVSMCLGGQQPTFLVNGQDKKFTTDCFFPVLHGTHGEDGCVQGLLTLAKAPCVGADVLSSAICMDKDLTKQVLEANGIATTPWVCITQAEVTPKLYKKLSQTLGKVLFVKPNSLGSSVGVRRITSEAEFERAVKEGFIFDERLVIESCVVGREIECAVLGNEDPIASIPAEVITHGEFYSYQAKYLDSKGATTEVPAKIPNDVMDKIRKSSVEAFRILRCSGMLRVDFFLSEDETVFINEVNSLPGFTNISMYPQMWQASGIAYPDLLDKLVTLAIERKLKLNQLERVFSPCDETSELEQKHLDNRDRL